MRDVGRRAGMVIAAGLLTAWGCGGGAPAVSSSSTEVKVKGVVKLHGLPATGGEVSFNPANINRKNAAVRTAEIKPDGAFEVTTLVGENMISVTGPAVAADPKLAVNQRVVDIKNGDEPIEIQLP